MNKVVKVEPWDAPLAKRDYIEKFPIMVIVYYLNTDTICLERQIDYGNAGDRKLLGKISFWAMTNGMSIETMSLKDYENLEDIISDMKEN